MAMVHHIGICRFVQCYEHLKSRSLIERTLTGIQPNLFSLLRISEIYLAAGFTSTTTVRSEVTLTASVRRNTNLCSQ